MLQRLRHAPDKDGLLLKRRWGLYWNDQLLFNVLRLFLLHSLHSLQGLYNLLQLSVIRHLFVKPRKNLIVLGAEPFFVFEPLLLLLLVALLNLKHHSGVWRFSVSAALLNRVKRALELLARFTELTFGLVSLLL